MSLPRLVASLSCVLVLVGCGGEEAPDASSSSPSASAPSTPSPSVTSSAPTPTPKPSPTPSPKPTPTPTPTAPPAPPPAKDSPPAGAIDLGSTSSVPQFDNESTTVTCLFEDDGAASVRCDVMPPSGWKVAKPADCQDAYGDAVMLAARARLVCHGDTIWSPDTTKVIRKGQTYRFKDLWCTAGSTTEVTCRNPDGHGFTASQQSYRVF